MEYELILDDAAKVAYEGFKKLEPGTKEYGIAVDAFVKIEEAKAKFKKINYDEWLAETKNEADRDIQERRLEMELALQEKKLEIEMRELELKIAQMEANRKQHWWMPSGDTMLISGVLVASGAVSYAAEGLGVMTPKAMRGLGIDKLLRFIPK